MIVYRITNLVNGKVYVGQTTRDLHTRWKEHCWESRARRDRGYLIGRAIKKYGNKNFSVEVLESCDSLAELDKKERYWIRQLNSNKNGYNIEDGGNGGRVGPRVKARLSRSLKEKKSRSFDVYLAIPKRGTKGLGREYEKGRRVGTWTNMVTCAEDLNLSASQISACLRGRIKTHKKYIFEYPGKPAELGKPKVTPRAYTERDRASNLKRNAKPFSVHEAVLINKAAPGRKAEYSKGKLVGVWENKSTCAEDLGIGRYIGKALKEEGLPQYAGYVFEYVDP